MTNGAVQASHVRVLVQVVQLAMHGSKSPVALLANVPGGVWDGSRHVIVVGMR